MNPKFFNFIDPALDYVDSGKFFRQPFKWLYYLIGIATFFIPYQFIDFLINYSKYMKGGEIFGLIILTIIWLAVAYTVCLLWFKRANQLKTDNREGQRFIAIPLLANFIQVVGEALGTLIGVGGFLTVLFCLVFSINKVPVPVDAAGSALIICPIIGYLTVIIFRFLAENALALANIANNTEAINKNTQK